MSLSSWFRQTIGVASSTGVDSYGKPTYSATRTVYARVEAVSRLVRSSTGEEAVASHVIWTTEAMSLTDRIWLPGVSTATVEGSRLPLLVEATPDKTGARTLYKVTL